MSRGTPSATTLRIRAMARVERLKAKIAQRAGAEIVRRLKFDEAQGALEKELERMVGPTQDRGSE